jgi:uncharacterized protein YegP (UPF0339 family)
MIRLADEWVFYQDKNGQWQWRKFVANKIVAVSFDGFPSRKKCVHNAIERGYISPLRESGIKK